MDQVTWAIDNLERIGGYPAAAEGHPWLFFTHGAGQVAFNGVNDLLVVDANPLQGATAFTVEALFYPAVGGGSEQRFVHFQNAANNDRVLLETRLTPDGGAWYADTFIGCGGHEMPLNDPALVHPLNAWHTLALTFDGREMVQYVNGVRELSAAIDWFVPLGAGRTAFGARINRIWWFKGSVARLRVTRRALGTGELWRP